MPFRVRNAQQFWAGAVFIVIGAGALVQLPKYDIGTAAEMGPGYLAMVLGILLVGLGLAAMVSGVVRGTITHVDRWALAPVLAVTIAVASFDFLIERAGLAVSILALIVACCWNRLLTHPLEILIIYLSLFIVSYVIFIYFVRLPISVFW
jgi:Tripartite tricarboxylate transporter TctB family